MNENRLDLDKMEEKEVKSSRYLAAWLALMGSGGILLTILALSAGSTSVLQIGLPLFTAVNAGLIFYFSHLYQKREEELIRKSYIDDLTGLKNTRYLSERIDELLARYEREGEKFALIFLDLDNFKQYNQSHGHTFGDQLLGEVAGFLEENCRTQDTITRYGGDEFIILCPGANLAEAQRAAFRIKDDLSQHTFSVEGRQVSLQLSGGVSVCPEDGTDKKSLLEAADSNLHQAKEQRNSIIFSRQRPSLPYNELKQPIEVNEADKHMSKIERKTTSLSLLAKQGDLEVIRQKIDEDKVFRIKGEDNHFEWYFLLRGRIIRQKDEKEINSGGFITVKNTEQEVYFKTLEETLLLCVTTNPVFESKQEQFRRLVELNEEVREVDRQTEAHCDRLQSLSLHTGEKLELDDNKLFMLGYASFLHDIGKIKVNPDILSKNAELTEDEWQEIEKHPVWGREIIAEHLSRDFFQKVGEIVHQHHEHYDGSGYPDGLEGEEIMIEAQILSVADAFDAMTTERPYKEAKSRQEARETLRREKGRQFSPEVVEAFLEAEAEISRGESEIDKTG